MSLSNTLKLGACGLPEEPNRNAVLGKSLATLRAAASTAKTSPPMSSFPPLAHSPAPPPRPTLPRKALADDELVAAGGVFAQHALVIGVGDILAGPVVDLAARLRRFQRLVDAADPLLLERHRVDRRHAQLGLRRG